MTSDDTLSARHVGFMDLEECCLCDECEYEVGEKGDVFDVVGGSQ